MKRDRRQRLVAVFAAAAAVLGLLAPQGAAARGRAVSLPLERFAPASGNTLPPVGFVDFCRRNATACARAATAVRRPALSDRQWDMVRRVNAFVNADVAPASDQQLYGQLEYWAYPEGAGDCEDYALLKQRYLEELGLPRAALLITVVLDPRGDGHAVLTLATSEGDFILDNRRDDIRRWSDADYTFLKRQSDRDPRAWVSLAAGGRNPAASVAARSAPLPSTAVSARSASPHIPH